MLWWSARKCVIEQQRLPVYSDKQSRLTIRKISSDALYTPGFLSCVKIAEVDGPRWFQDEFAVGLLTGLIHGNFVSING